MTGTQTARIEESKTLTIRLGESFHRRLRAKLLADGTNFQAKVQAMLQEYVDGPAGEREEIARQSRHRPRSHAPLCSRHAGVGSLTEPVWVDPLAVTHFHGESLIEFGGSPGIRDPGAIESALARPRNLLAYGNRICAIWRPHTPPDCARITDLWTATSAPPS
jgi:hypothetical protein